MTKMMLVLDNSTDQMFLEKVLKRLRYDVIALNKGEDLPTQLIEHFPDILFASNLGKNQKILSALGRIKEARGKPKIVFVRQEKESGRLTEEQKGILDGVLYSPIDPFKLIDLLSNITGEDIVDLRKRYNETLKERPVADHEDQEIDFEESDRLSTHQQLRKAANKKKDYGETVVFGRKGSGKNKKENVDLKHEIVKGKVAKEEMNHIHHESASVDDGSGKDASDSSYGRGQVFSHPSEESNSRGKDSEESHQEQKSFEHIEGDNTSEGTGVDADQDKSSDSTIPPSSEFDHQAPAYPPVGAQRGKTKSPLIFDENRKSKYDEICANLEKPKNQGQVLNAKALREAQKTQQSEIKEAPDVKANRKHFLKTMFTMAPIIKKK